MAPVACGASGRCGTSIPEDDPSDRHLDLPISTDRLDRVTRRRVETGTMRPIRLTNAHQSITFSRRMLLLGGAQAAIGGLLIGRMAWLSVAQNAKYQLLSESNRVQLIPVPPRRGWIIDRKGKPIAINRSSFRVDIIPQQLVDGPNVVAKVAGLLQLPSDEVDRINRELAVSRGFQRFYPGGSTVGQLVGYVGAASAAEYEKENKNPLLLIPGVKIGKEGIEQTLESTLRG